jgi:hypothetical protein
VERRSPSRSAGWAVDVDDRRPASDPDDHGLDRLARRRPLPVDQIAGHVREVAGGHGDCRVVSAVLELEPALKHKEVGVVVGMVVPSTPIAGLRSHESDPTILGREGLLSVDARRLLGLRLHAFRGRDDLWSHIHRDFSDL